MYEILAHLLQQKSDILSIDLMDTLLGLVGKTEEKNLFAYF